MHGGLFSKDDVKIEDIKAIDRNRQPPESGDSMFLKHSRADDFLPFLQFVVYFKFLVQRGIQCHQKWLTISHIVTPYFRMSCSFFSQETSLYIT